MARSSIAGVRGAAIWRAAVVASLVTVTLAALQDGPPRAQQPGELTAHLPHEDDVEPELLDFDESPDEGETPDELPDYLYSADEVDPSDADDLIDPRLVEATEGLRADEELATLPPLLTQDVPLTGTVDSAGITRDLHPRQRCLVAGLAAAEADVPAIVALAVARAAVELAGAPASAESAESLVRADLEHLGALGLVHAPAPGRVALHPAAHAAGAELLAVLPDVAADCLGDAMLRAWLDLACAADQARVPREALGLRGALLWARARGRHRALIDLMLALAPRLAGEGLVDLDERTCFEWAGDAARALGDVDGQLWAAHHVARLLLSAGDSDQARAQLEDALALSTRFDRTAERREELHALALLDVQEGDAERAWVRHQEALALAQRLGDPRAQREELHSLAVLDAQGGRIEDARAGFTASLELARAAADLAAERSERHALAVLDARDGRLDDAREGFTAALELARRLGDRRGERSEVHELAALDARAGRVEAARAGFEAALALARELDDASAVSIELQSLGFRDLNMGRLVEARAELDEALAVARKLDQPLLIARALWSYAELYARLNLPEEALSHYLEALRLYERLGDPDAHIAYIRLRLRELGYTA